VYEPQFLCKFESVYANDMVLRNGFKKIEFLLLSPYFLAFIVAFALIWLLPDFFRKYEVQVSSSGAVERNNSYIQYVDVNQDGYTEELSAFNNSVGKASIKIKDHFQRVLGHLYFDGILAPRGPRFFWGDYNGSGKNPIFMFVQRNDSLFLDGVEYGRRDTFLFRNKFIATVHGKEGVYDYQISDLHLIDMDMDGTRELLFDVMAGFPLMPRAVFVYNISRDTLISMNCDGAYIGINDIADLDGDRYPEILCTGYAINNYPAGASVPYPDSMAWLMIFNAKLKLNFSPTGFPGYTSSITPVAYRNHDKNHIAAVYNNHSAVQNNCLYIFDPAGNMLKKKNFTGTGPLKQYALFSLGKEHDRLFLTGEDPVAAELNDALDTVQLVRLDDFSLQGSRQADVDSDGAIEFVVIDNYRQRITIVRNDFADPAFCSTPFPVKGNGNFSMILRGEEPPVIFIQSGDSFMTLSYSKNPFHYFKYASYVAIYLVLSAFILLIRKLQRIQIRRKQEAEKQITDLRLKIFRSQVDPHFIFNAINSIGTAIYKENRDEAYLFLNKFSRLIRFQLENSNQIHRSLQDEILFVTNYLELEKFRFKDQFDYHILIDPDVDQMTAVPKMVIQAYAENAVKHGLRHLESGGELTISVENHPDYNSLRITIQDNGIGRKKAAENGSPSTGNGMQIMENFYAVLNRLNKSKISYEILDLEYQEKIPAGTKVIIHIPTDLHYENIRG